MSHFVTPSDEKARSAFEDWLTVQLADNWGKGFKDGVLQLKVPPEMVKTDNRDDGDDQGEDEGDNQGDENKDTEGTSETTDLLASRYRSTKVYGCFSVTRETEPITLDDLPVPEKEPIVPTGGFKHFKHSLSTEDGLSDVRYYPDIVATVKVRHHLGISREPFKGFRGGSLQWTTTTLPGVHQSYIYVSGKVPGSPFTMHLEDWNLYSLDYLHTGASKAWIVVRPRDRVRLEERARDYHAIISQDFRNDHFCSQFVRHLALWIPPKTLDGWGVDCTRILQEPGDLVVTAPGAYHQGWNTGWNVAEAVNYGDGYSPSRIKEYEPCDAHCMEDEDVEPMVVEWTAHHVGKEPMDVEA